MAVSPYEVVRAADIHVVGFFTPPREKQVNYANAKPLLAGHLRQGRKEEKYKTQACRGIINFCLLYKPDLRKLYVSVLALLGNVVTRKWLT